MVNILEKVDVSRVVTQWIPVEDIEDHPDNFNNHPSLQIKQLGASHEQIGQYRSIVVWARPGNKYIRVTGHGYSAGAQSKGETVLRAEVLPEDTSPDTVKAIMLADNLHARNSVPDEEKLGRLLQKQRDAGARLSALGTDDEAVRQLLKSVENSHATDFLKPLLATPALSSSPSLSSFAPSSHSSTQDEAGEQGEAVPSTGNEYHSNGSVAGGPTPTEGYVSATYLPFTVSVLPEQRQTILSAIKKAQQQWELETSQNALTAICQQYLQQAS